MVSSPTTSQPIRSFRMGSQDRIRRNMWAIIVPRDDSEKRNEMVDTLIN